MATTKNTPKDKKPISGRDNGSKEEGSYDRSSLEDTENGAFRKPVKPEGNTSPATQDYIDNDNAEDEEYDKLIADEGDGDYDEGDRAGQKDSEYEEEEEDDTSRNSSN